MTHIDWQPIETWPANARKTYLLTNTVRWGIGSTGWFSYADFHCPEPSDPEMAFTHWAEIGELPK